MLGNFQIFQKIIPIQRLVLKIRKVSKFKLLIFSICVLFFDFLMLYFYYLVGNPHSPIHKKELY